MLTEDWSKLEVGSVVYALTNLYNDCDVYGKSRYAKKLDKLIVRGFSEYSPYNPWVSHEDVTDNTGFYISKNEVSIMKHFEH
jgi:hypothetical protein